ncbi:hypothetical protein LZ31DRAFT_569215 [Colletotrichum somersetense]|nr:hypothetical protein LZ31DRAFT_569215 [Colletotrichum somersetense]
MDAQRGAPVSRYRGCDAEDSFLLPIFLAVADTRPRAVTTIPITSKTYRGMHGREGDFGALAGLPVMVANSALADIKPTPQWERTMSRKIGGLD